MKMFNIYRIKGNNNDIYNFELFNSGNDTIKILKNSIIKFENKTYQVIKDTIINFGVSNILPTNLTYSSYEYQNPIFSAGGEISFDKKDIEYNDNLNISEYISKFIKLISYEYLFGEQEDDLSFLERSKSLLQSMGYSNNKKIENILLQDSRIRNVIQNTINGSNTITIFPNNLKEIKSILDYGREVVRYYQNSNIELIGPNIIEIKIKNLKNQLIHILEYEKILNLIYLECKEYLSNSIIDNKILRNDLIDIIKNVLKKNNINDYINYNIISINNYFYWHSNYESPILIEEITDYLDIETNNMITLSDID